jgi:hypothetical protein
MFIAFHADVYFSLRGKVLLYYIYFTSGSCSKFKVVLNSNVFVNYNSFEI